MASDDSDSSGSDFEDVQMSDKDMSTLLELEQQLESNPNSYDTHLQYIEVLRRNKLVTKLRAARSAMQQRFPLTEALWLEWVEDESQGDVEWAYMESLFKKAINDYLSVALWERYLQMLHQSLVHEHANGNDLDDAFSTVAEQAITTAGLHPSEGDKIWAASREHLQSQLNAKPDDADLRDKVLHMFHRQLQVPLLSGPDTLAAYKTWAGSDPPAAVQSGYIKAQAIAAARKDLEAAVAAGKPADMDLLASFMAYVKLEQSQGDPARVQLAYERAVAVFPVTHYLWSQYAKYMEQHLGRMPQLVHAVYQRALRNCPWVGPLWAGALRAAERLGSPQADQESLYNQALQAGMQTQDDYMEVILARVDAIRRQVENGTEGMGSLRAAFIAADGLMQSYFPGFTDPALRIPAYRADCEMRLGKDIKTARSVWEAALKTPASRSVEIWAGYIAMEVREGNVKEARSLYKRCHAKQLQDNGQLSLCQAWQRFEREHGSPEDHFQACLKTEPLLSKAAAEADAQLAAAAAEAAARAPKPQLSKDEMAAKRREHDPTFKAKAAKKTAAAAAPVSASAQPSEHKRKATEGEIADMDVDGPSSAPEVPASKKPRNAAAAPAAAAAPSVPDGLAVDGAGPSNPASAGPSTNSPPATGMDVDEAVPTPQAAELRASTQPQEAGVVYTAFVKHLKENVDEAALREIFKDCGAIKSMKIGREAETNRSRGFAYVDFATEEALQKAVELDDLELEGKHLLIAPSRGRGRGNPGGRGPGRGPARGAGPGRGQQQQQQQQQQPASQAERGRGQGGRGRGRRDVRGRGGEGRGHPGRTQGLGYQSEADDSHARRLQQQVDVTGSATPAAMFRPRAIAKGPAGDKAAPKSNSDFRQMLMDGKK